MRARRLSLVLLVASACVDDPDAEIDTTAEPSCFLASSQSWRTPVSLGTTVLGSAEWPHVATSVGGTAMTVWLDQINGTTVALKASRMTAGVFAPMWTALADAATFGANIPRIMPEVAIDGFERAMVLWVEHDSTTFEVHARRYDPATATWGAEATLDTGGSMNDSPQLSIAGDGAGNFLAVWDRGLLTGASDIRWARFSGGAWGATDDLETSPGFAARPIVRANGAGKAIAVWNQIDVERRTYTRRFDPSTATWDAITLVDAAADGFPASGPNAAINANGDAAVSWYAVNPLEPEPNARVWTATAPWGMAWSAPLLVEGPASTNFSRRAGVALDGARNAYAVWPSLDGSIFEIHAQRLLPNGTAAAAIETLTLGDSDHPQLTMIANGNGHAVWRQADGATQSIYTSRLIHRAATFECPEYWGWTSAAAIETSSALVGRPSLGGFTNGAAVAVWFQNETSPRQVMVAHYR